MLLRKAWLNVEMALTPYFVGGMLAVAPLVLVWYHKRGREAWETLASRPLLKLAVLCTLAGGCFAMLLNDTGVIAWALATACALLLWLDLLLQTRLEAA
jgi:hypothetical protein